MTKDDIIKALRDMAKYPTVTLPRDCNALRAAADLLAQPEQEPVAWVCFGAPGKRDIDFEEADINKLPIGTFLYTTPPQRTWVGLTPKEVAEIVIYPMNKTADLVRIIEAKLKEKNEKE
jgi:hypothetical protein